jgi:TDG/mug DNA glycosylase family protein
MVPSNGVAHEPPLKGLASVKRGDRKPTREQIAAAAGRTVPDIIAEDLRVLFCGINPSLYSAAIGHHFGRPGNRFWPALHAAGFTERLLSPSEDRSLLALGYGITNFVDRATAKAAELTSGEVTQGGRRLVRKVRRFRPRWVALLGVGPYRIAFGCRRAMIGPQPEGIGDTNIWVLPNPSGLNAHFTPGDLGRLFGELRRTVIEPAEI